MRDRLPWIISLFCISATCLSLVFHHESPPSPHSIPSNLLQRISALESLISTSINTCPDIKQALNRVYMEVKHLNTRPSPKRIIVKSTMSSMVSQPSPSIGMSAVTVTITGTGFLVATTVDPLPLINVFKIIPLSSPHLYFIKVFMDQGQVVIMDSLSEEIFNDLSIHSLSENRVLFHAACKSTNGSSLETIATVLNSLSYVSPAFPEFARDYGMLRVEIWQAESHLPCVIVSSFSVVIRVLREMYHPLLKSLRPNTLPEHAKRSPSSLETDVTIIIKTMDRYPKLISLLNSIRRFYSFISIVIADDSKQKKIIRKLTASGDVIQTKSMHGTQEYADEIGFGTVGKDTDIIDDRWNNVKQLLLPYDVGAPSGRLAALAIVKTKYFLVLDDDHLFTKKTKLDIFYKVLESDKYDLVGGTEGVDPYHAEFKISGNQTLIETVPIRHEIPEMSQCYPRERTAAFFMARRTTFLRFGGWANELYVGDHTDMFVRMKGRLRVISCPNISVDHNNKDRFKPGLKPNTFENSEYLNMRYYRESFFRARIFWKWQCFSFEAPFEYKSSEKHHGPNLIKRFTSQEYINNIYAHFSCAPTNSVDENRVNASLSRRYSESQCLTQLNKFEEVERKSWED